MDIGLFVPLPLSKRGYLIYQALGSVFVNALINFGFAWPTRHLSSIPLFGGQGSVALDTCCTAFLLSGLTVLSGSWFLRRDMKRDVVRAATPPQGTVLQRLARNLLLRALAFAAFFGVLSIPIGLGASALRRATRADLPAIPPLQARLRHCARRARHTAERCAGAGQRRPRRAPRRLTARLASEHGRALEFASAETEVDGSRVLDPRKFYDTLPTRANQSFHAALATECVPIG